MIEKKNLEKGILIRYFSIVILFLFFQSDLFLDFFINLFTLIAYNFLQFFIEVKLVEGALYLTNNNVFLIIEECIAPNAYMLITLVFFTLPINLKNLWEFWFKSFLWFSFFNLIRILFLMWVHVVFGQYYFEKYHLIFYQGLSGVVVALICIYYLRRNNIKGVFPMITDIKYLINGIRKK